MPANHPTTLVSWSGIQPVIEVPTMNNSRKSTKPSYAFSPADMQRLHKEAPGFYDYIKNRRARGIPAQGKSVYDLT